MNTTITKVCKDLGYTIVADPKEHYVDFKVYQIGGEDLGGRALYGHHFQPDPEGTLVYLSGFVRWDGCSNWRFDQQDKCMLHGCSREDLVNLGLVAATCWDMAAELIPGWEP